MLKIERAAHTATAATYALAGKISATHLPSLRKVLRDERAAGRRVTLDLEGVGVVDRSVVAFFRSAQKAGIRLHHCPSALREWLKQPD